MNEMIHKSQIKLTADPSRVILQPLMLPGPDRVNPIFSRVEKLTDGEVSDLLSSLRKKYGHRHKNFESILKKHYFLVGKELAKERHFDEDRQILAGSLLTKEYSIESAALFNPSVVPHPDQSGLQNGQIRFVMSFRATGEGHVSSIVFRTGIFNSDGSLELTPLTPYQVLGEYAQSGNSSTDYDVTFDKDSLLEERVIFPGTSVESMGMEDLRLVHFHDEKGSQYYGTYTAYNGREIQSRLLETEDFRTFRIRSLTGPSASDKGMGLFPEKINGKYAIISRQGGESVSIMFSDDLYRWNKHDLLLEPKFHFELTQIGNCGSPVRTDKGWLLLTHGVGLVREYYVSAVLLDLEDPAKILGRLNRPLISAEEEEREGYVPNVVYSCGGMIFGDKFFIPYAMSDSRCGFAWVETTHLLDEIMK